MSNNTMGGPPPPPPEIASVVEAVRKQLAQVLTLQRACRVEEARELAQAALLRTETLGYRPVRAEVLAQLGRLLDGSETAGARDEVERLYLEALEIAQDEHHDELAAMIWSRLVVLAVQLESGTRRALELWDRAAAVRRIGDGAYEQARLHHMRSEIYYRDGRYADAVAEENLAIATTAGAPEQPLELSRYYDTLAKSLERAGQVKDPLDPADRAIKVEDALELHERALELAGSALGAAHPDLVKLRMNYGIALKRQGRFQDARSELEAALDSMPRTHRDSYLDAGIILGYLSELSYAEGRLEEARELGDRSLEIYLRAEAPAHRLAEAYVNLGNAAMKSERFADALGMYRRALQHRRELGSDHFQVGVNQGSIAEALVRLSCCDEAMIHVREAERIFAGAAIHDRETQGWILMVHGEVLLCQNKPREAIPLLEQALPLCEGVPDRSNQACTTWALARALHRARRMPDRVRQLAVQARELFAGLGDHDAGNREAVEDFIARLPPPPPPPQHRGAVP